MSLRKGLITINLDGAVGHGSKKTNINNINNS